jgi:hypothetical protein
MSYNSAGCGPIALAGRAIIMESTQDDEEDGMSMQSEGKDAKGRNYDQVTKDGSTSIGTLGAGGTASTGGGASQAGQPGNMQEARTDDLLSDGSEDDRGDGYRHEEAGELQTGMGGIGSLSTGNAGSRQSDSELAPDDDKDPARPGARQRGRQ